MIELLGSPVVGTSASTAAGMSWIPRGELGSHKPHGHNKEIKVILPLENGSN